MDIGRKFDIEDVMKARDSAKTVAEREMYEMILHRMRTENAQISALRQKLILAIRAKDHATEARVKQLIHMVQLNATYGKSWGNNKGNQLTNRS